MDHRSIRQARKRARTTHPVRFLRFWSELESAAEYSSLQAAFPAGDLPRATGAKRFITEVRGVSRALEASISLGDRRQRYVRWRRANWALSLRA
jgi:hypothetical protein